MLLNHLSDLAYGVEHSGGRLAMYRCHVSDGLVCRQLTVQLNGVVRNVSRGAEDRMLDAGALQHRNHALAVGAVGQHQDLAARRYRCGKHSLDAEGTAALQRNGFEAGFWRKTGQSEDSVTHAGHDSIARNRRRAAWPASPASWSSMGLA